MTPEQNTDRLLSAYFRRELPQPWPALPVASPMAVLPVRSAEAGSRYALAASVAILLGCCWILSDRTPTTVEQTPTVNVDANAATANVKDLRPKSMGTVAPRR